MARFTLGGRHFALQDSRSSCGSRTLQGVLVDVDIDWVASTSFGHTRESLRRILIACGAGSLRHLLSLTTTAICRMSDAEVIERVVNDVCHGQLTLFEARRGLTLTLASVNATPGPAGMIGAAGLRAASNQSARTGAGSGREGPPQAPAGPVRSAVRVSVIGEDDKALAEIQVRILQGTAKQLSSRTDAAGVANFESLAAGRYEVALPELDSQAWEVVSLGSLPTRDAVSTGDASWQAVPQAPEISTSHVIEQGECLSLLADRYGFETRSLWMHPSNESLRAARASPYVLSPGDRVHIPGRRPRAVNVAAGAHLVIRRRGVPEKLRIRFLDADGEPRAGEQFMLRVALGGQLREELRSSTDADGYVAAWIDPKSDFASITLGSGGFVETHHFHLGHLDPIDAASGYRARLKNLGCLPEGTSDADGLREFQHRMALTESGVFDHETRSALMALHLC